MQVGRQPFHCDARTIERFGLRLRLAHHFVVLGHQRRHFGGDLYRQGHRLADRFGQIAETRL